MSASQPTHSNNSPANSPVRVVISGAGPAGLLLANYLLTHGGGRFDVRMFDRGEDPRVTLKRGLDNRRWSIGLHKRSECALSLVPGLADRVRQGSVVLKGAAFCSGGPTPPKLLDPREGDFDQWVQDRIAICATMLDALVDAHADVGAKRVPGGADVAGPALIVRFHCTCTGVDLQEQTATFTPQQVGGADAAPFTEPYDLLVGADGLRSAVRSAFQQQMRDFEFEQKELFTEWGVAHFPPPPSFLWDRVYIVPVLPQSGGCTCVVLPSVYGQVCLVMGWNYTDNPTQWLECDTPEKAHEFWNMRLPHLGIPKEAAWNLRNSAPQRSMQVKCWRYHDTKGHAVLIGDAAHAACPSLGIGCNSSLVDASVLGRLLCGETVGESNRALPVGGEESARSFWGRKASAQEISSKIPQLLERFSALQVKEGQAVVDLSDAFLPINAAAKTLTVLVMLVLKFLSWILPFIVPRPVLDQLSNTGASYSSLMNAFWWECLPLLAWKDSARKKFAGEKAARVMAKRLLGS